MKNQKNIPQMMKEQALWCVWKYDGSHGKIPYSAITGYKAKTNDKNTFTNFQTAYNYYENKGYDGLGMGIFNGFCAIDIDHCINNGTLSDMAKDIINEMNSYTEISPSGEGIRIIFKTENFVYAKDKYYTMNNKRGLEVYVSGATNKYVTITGNLYKNCDVTVATDSLQKILDKYMLRDTKNTDAKDTENLTAPIQSDDKDYLKIGLEKDKKFKSLWNGNRNSEKSESQNDLAFFSKLMYWCNNDIDKVRKAFFESPYVATKDEAHRKKIERDDYIRNTIDTARSNRTAIQDNQDYLSKRHQYSDKTEKKKTVTNKNIPSLISATELHNMDLPPINYLIEDILAEGTSILVAPPKIGKSWFVLDMGLSIAAGKPFLGKETHSVGVLYFALEDSNRRLQDRMDKVLGLSSPPANFYFQTQAPTLDNGELINLLKMYIEKCDIKLIIIDTLQKIRRQERTSKSSYQSDYQDIGELKQFADEHNLSIFLVHHTRKMKDDDPYNMISGTNGIMGAADTAYVITKNKRSSENAVMNITGRDIEQNDFMICFDSMRFRWRMSGTLDEFTEQEEKRQYESNPIVQAISVLLRQSENHQWKGNSLSLINMARENGIEIQDTPQTVGRELKKLENLLLRYDNIIYKSSPNGNAGKIHHFSYSLPDYTPDIANTICQNTLYDKDDEECTF